MSDFVVHDFDIDLRATLARLIESGQRIAALRTIRERTGCALGDAKGCFQHLVIVPERCHWCAQEIPNAEYVDCARCGALNIGLVPLHSEV